MDAYRLPEKKEAAVQLELFYKRGSSEEPNLPQIREQGRNQVKILKR